jgi:ISXO2-like transposase domain
VRLALAENNDEATIKRFADAYIAPRADVTTDGLASYNARSLGKRQHDAVVQTKEERRKADTLQTAHWVVSLLKRWLLGTHGGAVKTRHLRSYLDEFQLRYNRRKTNGTARLTARAIEQLVEKPAHTMKHIIKRPDTYRALPEIPA